VIEVNCFKIQYGEIEIASSPVQRVDSAACNVAACSGR
jgi:hypothetical protein